MADLPLAEHRQVHGLRVRVLNTRPDIDTDQAVRRIAAALDLIAEHAPRNYRRLREDVAALVVERFPCRGAFFPDTRECLVELTFAVNPRHTLAEIASSIVHEATHARVWRRCGALPVRMRPREERLCRRAELEFGLALPAGPDAEVVLERARASLALSDREVAPRIDWSEGARRIAEVDARSEQDRKT
jgi:hypothetical protein